MARLENSMEDRRTVLLVASEQPAIGTAVVLAG